jgi:acyl dehydratase
MAFDPNRLLNIQIPQVRQHYGWRDCALYGLGLGFGLDPTSETALRYVYEEGLRAFPTMANILGDPGMWMRDLPTGIDWANVLFGEHALTLHDRLMTEDDVIGRSRVLHITDKGPGRGALLFVERMVTSTASGRPLATLQQTFFCRNEGGFGGDPTPYWVTQPLPSRKPDLCFTVSTSPQTALIYRLSSDLHPLHVSPQAARAAGFERPILHGLATHGIAGRALVDAVCDGDDTALVQLEARFSAPVYPGDTISFDIWQEERGQVRFRAHVPARGATVLTNGLATLSHNTSLPDI